MSFDLNMMYGNIVDPVDAHLLTSQVFSCLMAKYLKNGFKNWQFFVFPQFSESNFLGSECDLQQICASHQYASFDTHIAGPCHMTKCSKLAIHNFGVLAIMGTIIIIII